MARERLTFTSPGDLGAYLRAQTHMTGEQLTRTITYAVEDGIVLVDNGQVFGARAWEITYDDGIFQVVHEFGYLAPHGDIV